MIKICFVIGQLALGGSEKQLYLVLKYLDKKSFIPVVISFNPGKNDYWENKINDLGIEIYFVKKSRFKVRRFVDFFLLVNSIKPRIIQSWSLSLNFIVSIIGFLEKIPFVIGAVRQNLFIKGKKNRSDFHRFLSIIGLDYFLTNSSQGKSDLIKLGVNKEKIFVVFNGIECESQKFGVDQKRIIRERLGVPTDEIVIGSIGNLYWVKNYSFMLEIFSVLSEKYDNLKLMIFGEGPERSSIDMLSKNLNVNDKVMLIGQSENASKEIQAADIFLFTSLSEGMPNALIEASIAGLPIVTSNVNGASDVVIHDRSGYICDDYSLAAFVDYLSLLIEDRSKSFSFGQVGKETSLQKFDINKISFQLNNLYRDLVN